MRTLRTAALVFLVATQMGMHIAAAQEHEYSVGRATRDYADSTRQRWNGDGARPLAAIIWYPAEPSAQEGEWLLGPPGAPLFRLGTSAEGANWASGVAKYPLVVLSHGTGGSAVMLAWLGERLAREGYIVAAVNHHGNTSSEATASAAGFMLWWERATDLSALIDHLLADDQFGSRIDPTRIGAAGFSLGGYTVLAVAGARTDLRQWEAFCRSSLRDSTCESPPEFPNMLTEFERVRQDSVVNASLSRHKESYRDVRIRAVYAIAPVGTWLTPKSLRTIEVPVRVVVGATDQIAPAATNAGRIAELIPYAELTILDGVSHYTFLAECTPTGSRQRRDLCQDERGVNRPAVHQKIAADAVRYFNKALGKAHR